MLGALWVLKLHISKQQGQIRTREEQRNSFRCDKAMEGSFVRGPPVADCVSLLQLSFSPVNHADTHDQEMWGSDIQQISLNSLEAFFVIENTRRRTGSKAPAHQPQCAGQETMGWSQRLQILNGPWEFRREFSQVHQ